MTLAFSHHQATPRARRRFTDYTFQDTRQRLRTAAKIMKTAAKEGIFAKSEQADSLATFAKDNKEIVNGVLESLDLGVQDLNKGFPGMGNRVFEHAVDGPTAEFVAWAAQPSLEDPEDEYEGAVWEQGAEGVVE